MRDLRHRIAAAGEVNADVEAGYAPTFDDVAPPSMAVTTAWVTLASCTSCATGLEVVLASFTG